MSDGDAAISALKRLFFAITVDDGPAVWAAFSDQAKAYVLNLAIQQGMDFELASRLRSGFSSPEESEAYLGNLLLGLQHDLAGLDLSKLAYSVEDDHGGRYKVRYQIPLDLRLGPNPGGGAPSALLPAIPAGSAVMVHQDHGWRLDRLIPRPGG